MEKIHFDKFLFLYIFSFLFIIEPKIFTQYNISILIFSFANLGIFLFFFMDLLVNRSNKLLYLEVLWLIYRFYSFFIMLFNGKTDSIAQWGYLTLMVMNLLLVFNYSLERKEISKILCAIMIVGLIYLSINLITLLIYDRGIIRSTDRWDNPDNDYYFLGIKVSCTSYIFVFMLGSLLYYFVENRRVIPFTTIIIGVINLFVANVSTGIIMLFVLLILLFILKIVDIKFNMIIILLFGLIINVLFVFFYSNNVFEGIFNLLGKNSDLSGRVDIWKNAKDIISGMDFGIIFGRGFSNSGAWVPFDGTLYQAHNCLLNYLYCDGILGILLLGIFLLGPNNYGHNRNILLSVTYVFCVTIMFASITNSVFSIAHYYIPFIMVNYLKIYYSGDIVYETKNMHNSSILWEK